MRYLVSATILSLGLFCQTAVSACDGYLTWPNDAKLMNGVGSYGQHVRYFWLDSSVQKYASLIETARSQWVRTSSICTTSIDLGITYTKSNSVFDFYSKQIYPHSQGVLGQSYFYNSSDQDMGTPTSPFFTHTYISFKFLFLGFTELYTLSIYKKITISI